MYSPVYLDIALKDVAEDLGQIELGSRKGLA